MGMFAIHWGHLVEYSKHFIQHEKECNLGQGFLYWEKAIIIIKAVSFNLFITIETVWHHCYCLAHVWCAIVHECFAANSCISAAECNTKDKFEFPATSIGHYASLRLMIVLLKVSMKPIYLDGATLWAASAALTWKVEEQSMMILS